jgi:tetratricopeptide (TPR) repeat protein
MADSNAVSSHRQAGLQALARAAYREAADHFDRALEALEQLPDSPQKHEQAIDLCFDLRAALLPLGNEALVLLLLQEASELAETLNDTRRLVRVTNYLASHYWLTGRPEQAVESGEKALRLAASCGELPLEIAARHYLGLAYYAVGRYRQAIGVFGQTMAMLTGELRFQRLGLAQPPAVTSRAYMVWCLSETGAFDRGIAIGNEAVQIAESLNHPRSLLTVYRSIGSLYLRQGDLSKAIPVLQQGLRLGREQRSNLYSATFATYLGYTLALQGRGAESLQLLERAATHIASIKVVAEHALRVAWLSEGYLLAGRLDEAVMQAKQAHELARSHQERGTEAWVLRLLGMLAFSRGPSGFSEAEGYYRQAFTLATELGMRPLVAHCHLGLGTLYNQLFRVEQAQAELTMALNMYRDLRMPFWVSRIGTTLAR